MKRKNKNMNRQSNNQPVCSCCGCKIDPSLRSHFHHTTPTNPAEAADLLEEMGSEPPPSLGPDALMDMDCARKQLGEESASLQDEIRRLQAGDMVKVCVRMTDHSAPWIPIAELRHMAAHIETEAMWVRILAREGDGDKVVYRGELWSVPVFINPRELQIRSRVTFERRHIHSVSIVN